MRLEDQVHPSSHIYTVFDIWEEDEQNSEVFNVFLKEERILWKLKRVQNWGCRKNELPLVYDVLIEFYIPIPYSTPSLSMPWEGTDGSGESVAVLQQERP